MSFSLWYVKALRPLALGRLIMIMKNYTTQLWIVEGFKTLLPGFVVKRQTVHTANYLNALAANINLLENQPGAKVQPLADASL